MSSVRKRNQSPHRFTTLDIILDMYNHTTHEHRKILRMVELVRVGKIKKRDVDMHFKVWKVSVRYGNSNNLIHKLNIWYEGLWERN